jgi:hypothetical protein
MTMCSASKLGSGVCIGLSSEVVLVIVFMLAADKQLPAHL